jgi:hypothetical protein
MHFNSNSIASFSKWLPKHVVEYLVTMNMNARAVLENNNEVIVYITTCVIVTTIVGILANNIRAASTRRVRTRHYSSSGAGDGRQRTSSVKKTIINNIFELGDGLCVKIETGEIRRGKIVPLLKFYDSDLIGIRFDRDTIVKLMTLFVQNNNRRSVQIGRVALKNDGRRYMIRDSSMWSVEMDKRQFDRLMKVFVDGHLTVR